MLTDDLQLVSVDDHLIEHPRVWQDRLPAKFLEPGPRVVDLEDGSQEWSYDGIVEGPPGLSAVAGKPWSERSRDPLRFDEMLPGYTDASARCEAMDHDGVYTEVLFPSFSRFAGTRFLKGNDRTLALACVKAYNNFAFEEWQDLHPGRFVALTILPLWAIDLCVAEMQRCLALGSRGVTLPDSPSMLGLPTYRSGYWDPLLALLEESGTPMCIHFGSSGVTPVLPADSPQAAAAAVYPVTVMSSVTDLILSPMLERFPGLKVVLSESGIGWIPYLTQRVDQVWEHYRYYNIDDTLSNVRPSEFVAKNIFSCFIDDPLGVQLRDSIGVSQIMWESDYPHADCLYPLSRSTAAKVMADVPDDEVRLIMADNARRVFGL
jgi:predicted TIM-barrel fold metal-dependent hydrolase